MLDQKAGLGDDVADRHAAARPAAIGDDAEGAAMVAALLDLDEGARPALEARQQVRGGLAYRHDVGDGDPL